MFSFPTCFCFAEIDYKVLYVGVNWDTSDVGWNKMANENYIHDTKKFCEELIS
jgi:hypothetical protein